MLGKYKYWLCRKLFTDQLFNSDMSREIDCLVAENEKLKEELNQLLGLSNA